MSIGQPGVFPLQRCNIRQPFASGFDPSNYGPVALWLVGDDAPTGNVATWPHRMYGSDATQATVAKQPAGVAGALNGHKAVQFDGVDDILVTDVISMATGAIFVVVNITGIGSPDAGGVVDLVANVSGTGLNGWSVGYKPTDSKTDFYVANNGAFGTELVAVNARSGNQLISAVYNGSLKEIRTNGIPNGQELSTVDGSNTANGWGIGSRPGLFRGFNGYIAEFLMFGLGNTNINGVEQYLINKYAL